MSIVESEHDQYGLSAQRKQYPGRVAVLGPSRDPNARVPVGRESCRCYEQPIGARHRLIRDVDDEQRMVADLALAQRPLECGVRRIGFVDPDDDWGTRHGLAS
ncbi:MAG: hypothetical protein ABI429_04120 [Jatrophihabitantaceae bacterium]